MKPAAADNDGHGHGQRAEWQKSAEFYRQRADECHRLAESASDEQIRDEWLRLANYWTYLALHTKDSPTNFDSPTNGG